MSLMISAGDLQLEALFREPQDALKGGVVICHPHPLYGGTMDSRVVYRAAKAAVEADFAALRFNFRGVGLSGGQYDQGSHGGVAKTAEIFNRMDRTMSRGTLEAIENENPNLALSIRNLMFVFDDILLLSSTDMRKIIQRVERRCWFRL